MNEEMFYTPFTAEWLREFYDCPLEVSCGQAEKASEPDAPNWDDCLANPGWSGL